MMIDTHCHIFKEYYDNIDEVVNSFDGYLIVAGIDDKTNLEVIDLVNKYDNVYGVIGIQPEEVKNVTSDSLKIIEDNITNSKIVGIGEIGLDYYWTDETKDIQLEIFDKMMALARKYNKPVVIHSRNATQDTFNMIKKYSDVKCILHCYSSSLEMAREFTKLGVYLGIGGVVTFKNSKKLVEVVEEIPLDYLVLETDSPYLSPEPLRGKTNRPDNVYLVAQKVAQIKNITVDEVLDITTKNAKKVFNII